MTETPDEWQFDNIPEKLRERSGHWVCWRFEERTDANDEPYETKVPLKPFQSTHPYAKPNDADTWGDYEQAVSHHRDPSTETDGIGFMFSRGDVVVGADLDDVRYVTDDGTEHVEPWADDLITRLDAYTELSPSGTGYHILMLGTLPADAGSKTGMPREMDLLEQALDDPDDPNPGPDLELYDSARFFTMTGWHVEGTPTTLEQRNDVVQAVAEDYLIDDAGNESLDAYTEPGVEVTLDDERLIEKASDASNGDYFTDLWDGRWRPHTHRWPGGDSQSEADLAFCNLLAFWTQRDRHQMDRLFRSSGLMREKWDEDRGGQTYGEMTIEEAIRGTNEVYDPSPDRDDEDVVVPDPDPDEAHDELESDDGDGGDTANVDDDGYNAGVDTSGDGLPKPGPGAGFSESGGCYGQYQTDSDGDVRFEQWTNFEIEVNSFLAVTEDGTDRQYDLTIHPATGERPFDIAVTPDAFADPRRFRERVACGFSTTFDGDYDAVSRLKEFVAAQEAQHATGTGYMGRHGDEYVFPEGTLTADGWTDDPEHVYVAPGAASDDGGGDSLGQMCELSPAMGDDYDATEAGRVAELLPVLHDPERFLPVLGWYYAVPFRPIIYEWTGQFNYLSITGETGSGKTKTTGIVNKAFGMAETPLSASDTTAFSVMVTFASSNAVPVWYDEWKPSDMDDRLVKEFKGRLRQTTTEGTPQRGTKTGGVMSRTMKAPLAVGGEERVRGSAEERRGIFVTYPKGVTKTASDYRDVYTELNGTVTEPGRDLLDHALAYYQFALDIDRDDLKGLWMAAGRYVDTFCERHDIAGLEDLVEQGLVTIRFGLMLHNKFCDWLGTADTPIDDAAVDTALHYVATSSAGGTNRQTHVDEYLSLIARAALNETLVRDKHYTFTNAADPDKPTEFRFLPEATHDLVTNYHDHHGGSADLLGDYKAYQERFRDHLDDDGSYISTVGQTSHPMNARCDGVYLREAERQVPGFDRELFDAPEVASRAEATDGTTTTPIEALTPAQNYTDVVADVASVDTPDSPAIALSAVISDETGVIDLVQWAGEGDTPAVAIEPDAEYRFEQVAVRRDQDDAVQLVVEPGVTTATPVDAADARPDGYAMVGDDADAASEDAQASDGDRDTEPDGGMVRLGAAADDTDSVDVPTADPDEFDDARADVVRVVREQGPLGEAAICGRVADMGRTPDEAQHALDRLAENGRVVELPDGRYDCG